MHPLFTRAVARLRHIVFCFCLLSVHNALAGTFSAPITGPETFTLTGVHAGDIVVLSVDMSFSDADDPNEAEGLTLSYPGATATIMGSFALQPLMRFVAPQDAPTVAVTSDWFDGDETITLRAHWGGWDPENAGPVCPEEQACGDPINSGNGNAFQAERDYLAGGPAPLRFERFYNSLEVGNGLRPLGYHWTHTYDRWITTDAAGNAVVHLSTGKGLTFLLRADGTYQPLANNHSTLTALSGGGWAYRTEQDGNEGYNAAGQLMALTDRTGYMQVLTYDANNRLSRVTDPFGRTLQFSYDASDRLATMTDAASHLYQYTYDGNNNLTRVVYPDGTARQYLYESASVPHGLTGLVDENGKRYASWAYNDLGMATLSQLANGVNATSVAYNPDGTATITDAAAVTKTNGFVYGFHIPMIASSARQCPKCTSATRNFSYDVLGDRVGETDFDGNTAQWSYNLSFPNGMPENVTYGVNTPQAQTTYFTWQSGFRGLPTSIIRGKISTNLIDQEFSYDNRGRRLTQYRFTYTNNTWLPHNLWHYHYAADGVDANGNTLPGPLTELDDPLHGTRFFYDSQQNPASVVDAQENTTRFTAYDAHGRLLTLVDSNGVETDLAYDARGRLASVTAAGAKTSYGYDAAGNLTSITWANGAQLTYSYDDAHRLVGVADNLGNAIAYTLDALGNRIQTTIKDGGGNLRYSQTQVFDALSRLITIIGLNGNQRFAYDAQGNLTNDQDGRGNATGYAFDALNRLVQVTDALGKMTHFSFNQVGALASIQDPNEHTTAYNYDAQLGTLSSIASPDSGTTSFTYDEVRNRLSQTDADLHQINYTYDGLNRLTTVQPSAFSGQNVTYYYDETTSANGMAT